MALSNNLNAATAKMFVLLLVVVVAASARILQRTVPNSSDDKPVNMKETKQERKDRKETKQERKDRKKAARKKAKEAVKQKKLKSSDYFGRPSQAMTVFGSMKSVPLPRELLEEDQGGPSCRRSSLETEHVMKVYDTIADQWHGTRYKSWPKVAEFISRQPPGSLFGDLGCGNGKNIPACNQVRSFACLFV